MKRRKPALRPGDPRWPSVLSIVHAPFGLFLLVALLVLSLVVGRASTSAIHLINSGNFSNRARECGRDRKPLLQLQSFFLDQVHRNASTATSLCHNPDLLDAVVGCGNSANDAVKSRLTNFCRASSFAAGQPQIRTRRRTVSPAGTHFKKAITRENDKTRGLTSAPAKRRTRPENSKLQKKYKRINNLMAKTTCKPRKMILPILDVANLSENEKSVYTHSYHLEPCMVEVTRCGGCCTNDLLECSPTKIRTKKIPFLKLESSNGESTANEDNTVELYVDFHQQCACLCKIKEQACYGSQTHNPDTCSCDCPEQQISCKSNQYYDKDQCRCLCKTGVKLCSSGMKFDENTCRCS